MRRTLRLFPALAVIAAAALILTQCAPIIVPTPSSTVSVSTSPTTLAPSQSPSAPQPTPSLSVEPSASLTAVPSATPSATPTPSPTPVPPADPVQAIIDGMSNEELLGQMILLGFTGREDMPEEMAKLYAQYKVGGVMLFGWNVRTFPQTTELVKNLNAKNPYPDLPLFVCIDEEGGIVSRLPWRPRTVTAATLGRRNDTKKVYEQFLRIGKGLHDTGINMDLAPVLDVAPKLEGMFLGNRMYGTDPKKVILMTDAAIRGLHDGGVFSVGKHFPGHGNTASDSHKELPKMNDTLKRWQSYTGKPFEAAVGSGIDGMLVGHLLYPSLDAKNPASLSQKVMTGLLRQQMGFQGVIFSDDMRMGAITGRYDIGEACVRFIEAGGDVVFIGKYMDKETKALEALAAAVKSGRISRERLEESAYRVVSLKLKIRKC